jgi:hypothetical protein
MSMKKKNYYLSLILIFTAIPLFGTKAAILSLDPAAVQVAPGDTIVYKIRINAEGQCLNAFDTGLEFSNNALEFTDFASGESMISVWIEKPSQNDRDTINQNGKFNIIGGIPGGYCGKIPGDPGESDLLGEAVFKVKDGVLDNTPTKDININFKAESKILINDGQATEARVGLKGTLLVISDKSSVNKDEWNNRIKDDKVPPENFAIELYSDPSMFDGKYYIIFSTVDKQTGVDHYEIIEIKDETGGWWQDLKSRVINRKEPSWTRAQMPYLLEDQSLRSTIRVKALDKAGNERIIEYVPKETDKKATNRPFSWDEWKYVLAGVFIFLAITIIFIIKKHRNHKEV